MTNRDFAQSYLASAKQILEEAQSHFTKKTWHLAVRRCQESAELGLKAMLRKAGLEIPKIHDVGSFLLSHAERFPNLPLPRLVSISRRLREEREISFYGEEMTETPPEHLYEESDAQSAIHDAEFILSTAEAFVQK